MEEKFLVCIMIREPAEGSPGESMQNTVLADQATESRKVLFTMAALDTTNAPGKTSWATPMSDENQEILQ
jgi:hypothetical protein